MNFAKKDILQRHLRNKHNSSASSSLGLMPNSSEVASEIQPESPDSEEEEQEDEDEGLDEEG